MFRRIMLFIVGLAVASVATAGIREDWYAVAAAVRATGQSDSAARIEASVAGLSDEDLERVYGNADLAGLVEALSRSAEAMKATDEAWGGTTSSRAFRPGPVQQSVAGFPDAVGYPSAGLCPFSPDRSNADALLIAVDAIEVARIALEAAKVIWSGLSRACGETIVILGEGGNVELACIPADIVLFAAELVVGLAEGIVEHIAFCDGAVDSAEIEGSYERLGHLHTDWTSKFPGDVQFSRDGHGCNGIDDNSSGVIDECAEDTFSPVVHIDAAVSNVWYRSLAEASAAVARGFGAIDECQTTSAAAPVIAGLCQNVMASVTATDSCGNAATANTVVKVDASAPMVTINPDVDDTWYATVQEAEAAVLAATNIVDDCTSLADLNMSVHSTVTPCSLRVRVEATDLAGRSSAAAITVRVDPELPQVETKRLLLGFRSEVLGFQTPVCYDTAAEAEAAVLGVTRFADNCTQTSLIDKSVSSSGDLCSLEVTTLGKDECENENTDSVIVRVDDVIPRVDCSVAADNLWPPNHEFVDVGFQFTASDNCSGDLAVQIDVTSDERTASASGAGQASPAPDAEILRDLDGQFVGVRVRSERSNAADGRVYAISVTATDPCGNVGRSTCTVEVRSSPGNPAVDSGQFYDATAVN